MIQNIPFHNLNRIMYVYSEIVLKNQGFGNRNGFDYSFGEHLQSD